MKKNINLIVDDIEDNTRIDIFVHKREKDLSRTRIKNLIKNKNLRLNGKLLNIPSKKVSSGDEISISIPQPRETSLEPFDYKLDIIYEDNDLMIINKPSGLVMHPGAGNYNKTLVNALIFYDKDSLSTIGDELRPGIVHRIDKDTSGIIVIAKNNKAHEFISNQFNNHSVKRTYKLLIWGKIRPNNGRIETLITRSSINRQRMAVSSVKGKKAITNYNTLEIFENNKLPTFSFVECKLETGRTHQIRVHMNYLGHSIVGDQTYKKKYKKIKNIDKNIENLITKLNRQFLHASSLGLVHPTTKKKLEFNSNLPKDLENILQKLRNTKK